MVYLPTFGWIFCKCRYSKYTIHGCYGISFRVITWISGHFASSHLIALAGTDARTFWNVSSHRISIEGPLCWWASLTSPIATWVAMSCNLHIFRWFTSKLPIPSIAMMTSKVLKDGWLHLSITFEHGFWRLTSCFNSLWSLKPQNWRDRSRICFSHDCWTVLTETVGRSGLQSENPCWFSNDFPMACDRAGKLRRVYPNEDASRERFWASEVVLFGSVGFLVADFFDPKKGSIDDFHPPLHPRSLT